MIEITWELVAFVLFAAFLGNCVRKYDPPVTMKVVQEFVIGYGGALVASALAVWGLMTGGAFEMSYGSFFVIAGAAVGGMASVRAAISKFVPAEDAE
jgi:hypothetical protein